jgi:adenylate cyclase
VLITADTQAGIAGRLQTRFLGSFQLKGFEKAFGVYELVGQVTVAEAHKPLDDAFAKALKLFSEKNFSGAEAAFKDVLAISPNDGPSKFYLKFIAEIRDHPLPAHWKGEVELKEK